jgi:hypothetical protein
MGQRVHQQHHQQHHHPTITHHSHALSRSNLSLVLHAISPPPPP